MAITINSRSRASAPKVASPTKSYTVERAGFLAGTHYNAGATISLTERAAEYPLRARQISLTPAPTPAPAPKPATKSPAPAPTAAAPTAQVTNGTSTGN